MAAPGPEEDAPDGVVLACDIHRQWRHVARGLAALPRRPRAAVLLGDMECDQPLDRLAAPLLDAGVAVHWIWGDHDYDGGPGMWANLVDPDRNPRTGGCSLNARVASLGGVRVAGLGGTFRRRFWEPPAPPRLHGRAELAADVAGLGPDWTEAQRRVMAEALAAIAIWPEDAEALAGVERRGPGHARGALEPPPGLRGDRRPRPADRGAARRPWPPPRPLPGARRGRAGGARRRRRLGEIGLDGRVWWPGEPDRWLGPAPRGWDYL